VDHEGSASTSQRFEGDLADHWQRSTYGFIARRRGVARTWVIALLNFGGALTRWVLYACLAALSSDERHAARRDAWRRWAPVHLRALRGRAELDRLG
jgi:hypothetical protein